MSKLFIVPYTGTMTIAADSFEEAYEKAINKDCDVDDIEVNEDDIFVEVDESFDVTILDQED